jgi:hypothetical protein
VPLKDLVEDDAIHEPSEADPEEESGEAGAGNRLGGCFHVPASFHCGSHSRVAYPQPERLNASPGHANVPPPVRLDGRGRGHSPEDPTGPVACAAPLFSVDLSCRRPRKPQLRHTRSDTLGHDEVLLPLVARERLLERLGRSFGTVREFQHLGEVGIGVALRVEHVRSLADGHRLAG